MSKRVFLLFCLIQIVVIGFAQPVPVVLTAGQSNTDGRVLNRDLPAYIKQYKYCKWCYGSAGKIQTADDKSLFKPFWPKMVHAERPDRWAYDAVVYYRLEQAWKKPFYVVKWSLGGTAIDPRCTSNSRKYWSADAEWLVQNKSTLTGGKSLLKSFVEEIDTCLAEIAKNNRKGYDIKCMLWHQGESDYQQGADYYKNLKHVVIFVRRHLVEVTGQQKYAHLPFVFGTVSKVNKRFNIDVYNCMKKLAAEDKDIHLVDVEDAELQNDKLHFTAASAQMLGNRMADIILNGGETDEQKVKVAKWSGNRKAALTYTFDDGLKEHYTKVFPELKKRGMVASFGIIGSVVGKLHKGTETCTWQNLKEMSDAGMEITSHGYAHKNVTKLSENELRREVQRNDTLINKFVGKFPRTYFYPGNRTTLEAVAFVEKDRVGSRTYQVSIGSKRDSLWLSRWLHSAISDGKWIVGMTHGISTGYDCFTDPSVFFKHLDEAASLKDSIWIATLHDVLAYQKERDNTTFKCKTKGQTLVLTPVTKLNRKLYNVPLTIIVDGVYDKVTQKNKQLDVVVENGQTIVNILLDAGNVTLVK